jgi:hypothetical protein
MSISGKGKESVAFTAPAIIKLFAQWSEEFAMTASPAACWSVHD